MTLPALTSNRFTTQPGFRVVVQIPETDINAMIRAILTCDPLIYGDYDGVTFVTASGTQSFRALGTGRNAATPDRVAVPCCEVSFFLPQDDVKLAAVLEQIYDAHPYEEPVIFVTPTLRSLHISGLDEDNPNRFWNRADADWVPVAHRRDS